ncbi:MAG: RNA methyltransferase [Kiritimatiellae bacterium]|nr:RNA methyltransferase [Kiritimatiellia bacterium]
MNRILFEPEEIAADGTVAFGGVRAEHVVNVLHATPGKVLKTGVVGGRIGTGEVVQIGGGKVVCRCVHDEIAPEPWIDLILAPPRPRAFKRLLPQLVQLGVGNIFLVGAAKVEKMFWGATILKEEEYRPLMVDALMQCGTATLPQLHQHRNFRKFLSALDTKHYPVRLLAHPAQRSPESGDFAKACNGARLLLAIGPEGGWTDSELEMFQAKGFDAISLDGRILKTDTATVAIMGALLMHLQQ